VTQRVDFSSNAKVYDRRHGAALSEDVAKSLAQCATLKSGTRVLDIGAGTGRVSLPLAELGCDVIAMEPASGMRAELRDKALKVPLRIVAGDGVRLPFASGSFDVVILARLLYLVSHWRETLEESIRVLASGGHLLHEWGNGQEDEPWVQIREKTRSLFEQAGVKAPFHPGARSEAEVDAYLRTLGATPSGDISAGPGPTLTLAEFLGRLTSGELSYVWNVPREVQEKCLPHLMEWAEQAFDLNVPVPMPRELRWTTYRG
jgi:SAM-dependent methyltransferase